ncbi:hypothetical protein PFICI_11783 [Pestalotiopsis fici W106-1]|uniref:WHIM1 domain-containing protein n=1 Tax=Pestalotiopsis fici (strain W106-1 / CGMCC3.15140) TaxID=1229662 RepID=W3WU71_PESFW|nr:uncharacterized protein PFICI_11783 [Pestalotiopsis fici W106-1]ETS76396.1 hypothetical protein PFICI_11783 [Pestalotiopsis fici W106-1]
MADDDSSDLSSLSSLSPAPSDDENDVELKNDKGILKFFHKLPKGSKPAQANKEPSPPPRKRSPSPPHDYVLADNPAIAFIVMFRSRFNEAFPRSLANFGPQELERDVTESIPGDRVEHFLCAVLGLLLNRKQDVKPGHYGRALEDAIASHKSQWPKVWEEKSPLSGGATFTSMNPTERLTLLRTLVLWSLSSSDTIKQIINTSYKGNRRDDDLNQPLSVQPWGADSDKRRYFLIEGLDDTNFRVYRESDPAGFNRTWWSVAGNIEELTALAEKLQTVDGRPKGKKLAQQMLAAVPRFEASEEKRKRREYRQQQKERFKRPEPGFSMYEGRTRGKRMKYTYSDDEDFLTDSTGARRSARNTGTSTPIEPAGPVTTASGRHIKAPSRMTVDASNNIVTVDGDQDRSSARDASTRASSKESSVGPTGRPRRSAAVNHSTNGWSSSRKKDEYNSMDDDEEESEPELGDDEDDHVPDESEEEEEDEEFDEDVEMADEDNDLDASPQSMVVKLKVPEKEGVKIDFDKFRYSGTAPKANGKPSAETEETTTEKQDPAVAEKGNTSPPPSKSSDAASLLTGRPPLSPKPNALQTKPLAYRESPEKPFAGRPVE